jgi:PAS domain S-box-containing protein
LPAAPDRLQGRLFSRADHPIFVLDPGRDAIRYANSRACSLLGYGVDELLTASASSLFSAPKRTLQAFLEAILMQGEGSETACTLRTKSGAPLRAELLAFRLRSEEHPYVLVLANVRSAESGGLRDPRAATANPVR